MLASLILCLQAVAADAAPAAPAAPAVDLGRYTCTPLSADEGSICATDADYSAMVWSDAYRKVFLKGGGHAATNKTNVREFDPRTGTWREPFPPTPCTELTFANLDRLHGRWISSNQPVARHDYDLIVAAGDVVVLLSRVQGRGRGCSGLAPPRGADSPYVIARSTIALYSPRDGSWTYTALPAFDYRFAAEFDPLSGRVLIAGWNGLWWFDPVSRRLSKFKDLALDDLGWEGELVYARSADRFYWFARNGRRPFVRHVFEIAVDRKTPADSAVTPLDVVIPREAASGWAYDEDQGLIGGGLHDGVFYLFDPRSRKISMLTLRSDDGAAVGTIQGYAIAYVPPWHGYLLRTRSAGGSPHTFLYRPSTQR